MIEPILLAATQILTFAGMQPLTNATGFFFERDGRLYAVTSRHVVFDEPSGHRPDRIELELHTDAANLAVSTGFSIPLYRDGAPAWRQGSDAAGEIDVAVVEIDRAAFPGTAVYCAFTPAHVPEPADTVEIGTPLLVVGFPLGFHDTLHHLPVCRQATVASWFGFRFQGEGYFLTDGRTHRGISGAPVVTRIAVPDAAVANMPWRLLGIHSGRLDIGTRDVVIDEALGLNCAWYSDVLTTLTGG
jgi:S1-C subfamily serine protease